MTFGNVYIILSICAFMLPKQVMAQFQFSEVTTEAGIDHHYLGVNDIGGGAAFFDMDNDGDEDLWISGGMNRDKLYENDGTGQFTEIGESAGLNITNNIITTGVITGDLDNDGLKDVLLLTHRGFPNYILRNFGNNLFLSMNTFEDRAYCLAAAMGDINQDGFLDIYEAHYIEDDRLLYDSTGDSVVGFNHKCYENKLFINNGDWTFTEQSENMGINDPGCALATCFSDFDGDYDPDIIVANDFGAWVQTNKLFENKYPEHSFENISVKSGMDIGIYGMGIAVGDYDNDLDLDYYITNLGQNILLQNDNDGHFSDKALEMNVPNKYAIDDSLAVGWGTGFMDFDNDRDLDLYVVNGYVPAASFINNSLDNPNILFENDGTGYFNKSESSHNIESPLRGRGLSCADIDNDGDIDFLVINVNRQATSDAIHKVQLFRNNLSGENHWIKIKLEGLVSNSDGIGSRIVIASADKFQLQELNGGYGTHASQHSSIVHFGLGEESLIDSIIVSWPGGNRQVLYNIQSNHQITIQEQVLSSNENRIDNRLTTSLNVFPNPFSSDTQINYNLSSKQDIEIMVLDYTGQLIYSMKKRQHAKGQHEFRWKAPHQGIYYVILKTSTTLIHNKIISQHD